MILILTLIISSVSLFILIKLNIKTNDLLEMNSIKIPKGKNKMNENWFDYDDSEDYYQWKKKKEEERKQEEQKKQLEEGLETLKNNPELLDAIMKMV